MPNRKGVGIKKKKGSVHKNSFVTLKMGKSECKVLKIMVHAFGFQSFVGKTRGNVRMQGLYVSALKVKSVEKLCEEQNSGETLTTSPLQ